LLAGNTSSLALKGSCLPPRLLGCTRPRNTAGHRIASLPTSHLLLCTDSDRVSDSPPGTTVHAANFFLDRRLSPRPARRLSAPRQPTLRGAFCFDNSRTRAGPRGAQEPHRTAAGAGRGEPQSKVGVGIRPSSRPSGRNGRPISARFPANCSGSDPAWPQVFVSAALTCRRCWNRNLAFSLCIRAWLDRWTRRLWSGGSRRGGRASPPQRRRSGPCPRS
jgi:hypothetical protein